MAGLANCIVCGMVSKVYILWWVIKVYRLWVGEQSARYAYRHVAFPCLQLFLQFLHLLRHEHPVPPDVTRHFPAVFTQEAGE